MTVAVSTLLIRVRDLLDEHHHWFEAVEAWYHHDQWTKRNFIDHLASRNRPVGRPSLAVNDQPLNDSYRDRDSPDALIVWWVPASLFRAGENVLHLRIQENEARPVAIDSVSVQYVAELVEQTKRDHRPQPRPTAHAAVAVNLGLGYRGDADRWSVETRQQNVRIRVQFEAAPPSKFLAAVAIKMPTIGYGLLLEDLWDLVTDTVKDKMKELLKEYFRELAANDPRAQALEQQLHYLESYLELHETHLARMLPLSDKVTLTQVIEQARKTKPTDKAMLRREPPAAKPGLPTARTHWFVKLMVTFVALGVIAGAAGYVAWHMGMIDVDKLTDWTRPPPGRVQPMDQKRGLAEVLAAKKAKTGDVQVSLHWSNKNDLDLEVVAPSGEQIDLRDRASKCGGRFDFDMNVLYDQAVANPVEHIYWPTGLAPQGRYKVYVVHYRNHGRPDCKDPTSFTIRVVTRGHEQWAHREVDFSDANRRRVLALEFDVPQAPP